MIQLSPLSKYLLSTEAEEEYKKKLLMDTIYYGDHKSEHQWSHDELTTSCAGLVKMKATKNDATMMAIRRY